jgi:hypothetical protein
MDDLIKELMQFIEYGCPSVKRLPQQLREHEIKHLLELYPIDDIKKQLAKMDNWRDLNKKCNSVYRTCLSWFEMDIKKGFYKAAAHPNRQKDTKDENDPKVEFFRRFEIGSRVSINGNEYEVEPYFLRNLRTDAVLPIIQAMRIKNITKIDN